MDLGVGADSTAEALLGGGAGMDVGGEAHLGEGADSAARAPLGGGAAIFVGGDAGRAEPAAGMYLGVGADSAADAVSPTRLSKKRLRKANTRYLQRYVTNNVCITPK